MWYIYIYVYFSSDCSCSNIYPDLQIKIVNTTLRKTKNIVLNSLHVVYMWLNKKQTYQTAPQNSLHIDVSKI